METKDYILIATGSFIIGLLAPNPLIALALAFAWGYGYACAVSIK